MQVSKRLQAPTSAIQSSRSSTYDYSGLEDLVKRQDAVAPLREQKYAALYSGDIPGSVAAGQKIRDLLKVIQRHNPNATERDPVAFSQDLKRPGREESSSSGSYKGAVMEEGAPPAIEMPQGGNRAVAPIAPIIAAPAPAIPAAAKRKAGPAITDVIDDPTGERIRRIAATA